MSTSTGSCETIKWKLIFERSCCIHHNSSNLDTVVKKSQDSSSCAGFTVLFCGLLLIVKHGENILHILFTVMEL